MHGAESADTGGIEHPHEHVVSGAEFLAGRPLQSDEPAVVIGPVGLRVALRHGSRGRISQRRGKGDHFDGFFDTGVVPLADEAADMVEISGDVLIGGRQSDRGLEGGLGFAVPFQGEFTASFEVLRVSRVAIGLGHFLANLQRFLGKARLQAGLPPTRRQPVS